MTGTTPDQTGDVAEAPGVDELARTKEELLRTQGELATVQVRHLRALADLDNFRKRTERDALQRTEQVRAAVLADWLEAVDSVERALRMEPEDPGLTAVLQQMDAILAKEGVVRVATEDVTFDPERHDAISVVTTSEVPNFTILDVARSGFEWSGGAVIRPAQVVVSRPGPDEL